VGDRDRPFRAVTGAGDGGPDSLEPPEPPAPRVSPIAAPASADRIPSRYRRSAGATMLAAGMLGLRDAIEDRPDDEPVVEQRLAGGRPAGPVEVFLDPDDPAASMVVIRDPNDRN